MSTRVKHIIKKLWSLPPKDREVWLEAIMGEFDEDFSHSKWREGYEQGQFEGAWVGEQLKDADKIRRELNKVTVPQFVADWIEYCKRHNFTLFGCLDPVGGFDVFVGEDFEGDVRKCIRWCRNESDKLARAWIFGYEVEKVKRYLVKIIGITNYNSYLNYHKGKNKWTIESCVETDAIRTRHTRKELEEANFGWVFDCPGIEIEEV